MKKLLLVLSVIAFTSCNNDKKVADTSANDSENTEQTAEEATLKYKPSTTKLTWTAYKTPEKVGVEGTFENVEVTNTKESEIPEEVLEGATFNIKTSSASTGDESRDAKIVGLFFNNVVGQEITGTIGKFNDSKVPITIKMNDKEVTKDFNYTLENTKLVLTGKIDMLSDFETQKGFDLLHDACKQLHLEKTWTDVSIEVITEL